MITNVKIPLFAALFVVMLFPISGVVNAQDATSNCGLKITGAIPFGETYENDEDTPSDRAVYIRNTGSTTGTVSVIASHWTNDEGEEVMDGSQTRFATTDMSEGRGLGLKYDLMTPVPTYGPTMGNQDSSNAIDMGTVVPTPNPNVSNSGNQTGWKLKVEFNDDYKSFTGYITQTIDFTIEC